MRPMKSLLEYREFIRRFGQASESPNRIYNGHQPVTVIDLTGVF